MPDVFIGVVVSEIFRECPRIICANCKPRTIEQDKFKRSKLCFLRDWRRFLGGSVEVLTLLNSFRRRAVRRFDSSRYCILQPSNTFVYFETFVVVPFFLCT
jgi:hypothetical protein